MRPSRRATTVITATAGAIALLVNFHTTPEGTIPTIAAPNSLPPTSNPAGVTPTAASGSGRTVDGPVINTRYGPVQVRVTVQGNAVVDVQALELPSDRGRSLRISQQAGPLLRSEALAAQSAKIHVVSGATYTSTGYVQSLQGALDKATG
jgi:uncharacterized protein with FMN-binding domain